MTMDRVDLSLNSTEVLKRRYLLRDDSQNTVETPEGLFRRAASNIASCEKNFRRGPGEGRAEEEFYSAMSSLEFLPNSPTLMNAGTALGQLSACFVIPVEDSIDSVFESLKAMARIHQTGGGTGFSFSGLRPKGDLVETTKGAASGPVSFMSIFDTATGVIVQGGRRRGANMGVLRCDHPDIAEFADAKRREGAFSNFNLSVGITDRFMDCVKRAKGFDLVNPRTGAVTRRVDAKDLFDRIADSAWRTGDPGLVFLDEINRRNPTPEAGRIEATNPCGELPLLPYESCNLGSVNLAKMVRGSSPDWEKLGRLVGLGIRFLDDCIEVNKFPLPEIKKITSANRKIGLGVMGFADMLIRMGIPYGSKESIGLAGELMKFIRGRSVEASKDLAAERGAFPNYKKSVYAKKNMRMRNATVNTVAPTGSISIIAGCSSGIEPLFAVSYMRNILSGTRLFEVNEMFEEAAMSAGLYDRKLLSKIASTGSLRAVKGIPTAMKKIFVTAFDVRPEGHLLIQAAFQRYCDNSVSKTINLPPDASVSDVKKIYLTAHQLKLKGITVYRYGSKKEQALSFGYRKRNRAVGRESVVVAESEYSGGCAGGVCAF